VDITAKLFTLVMTIRLSRCSHK